MCWKCLVHDSAPNLESYNQADASVLRRYCLDIKLFKEKVLVLVGMCTIGALSIPPRFRDADGNVVNLSGWLLLESTTLVDEGTDLERSLSGGGDAEVEAVMQG